MHDSQHHSTHHVESDKVSVKGLGGRAILTTEPLLAFLQKRFFRNRWWRVAVTGVGIYYVGSVVAAWFAGTLYSRSMLDSGTDFFDISVLIRLLATVKPPKNGNFVPLLYDFAHVNFTVLVCLVLFPFGYEFMRRIPVEFRKYFYSTDPKSSGAEASEFLRDLHSSIASRWNVALALSFALFGASTFVLLARSKTPVSLRWWGNAQYGYAGYYLAFGQIFCCYYLMWGFIFLWILNRFIRRAALKIKTFHLFHSDGYYGFHPLSRLVAYQAGLILIIGVALFSTFYMGYFGLEKSILVLICMVVFTVGTGTALAYPLVVLTGHVRKIRAKAIASFEPQIHETSLRFGQGRLCRDDSESRYDLAAMMHLHDTIRTSRTIPFGFASLNVVILGYGLQTVALMREFYARYR
jgi:hypothetical protein